jgi:hypothetical protein
LATVRQSSAVADFVTVIRAKPVCLRGFQFFFSIHAETTLNPLHDQTLPGIMADWAAFDRHACCLCQRNNLLENVVWHHQSFVLHALSKAKIHPAAELVAIRVPFPPVWARHHPLHIAVSGIVAL